jgi:phosphatidylglycerophosphate synthase
MTSAANTLLVLPQDSSNSEVRVFGLTALQRLERAVARMGVESVQVLQPGATPPQGASGPWIVLRADLFYDERLLAGLQEQSNVLLIDELPGSEQPEPLAAHVPGEALERAARALLGDERPELSAGMRIVAKLGLAPAYNPVLRKFDPPFVFRSESRSVRKTENRIFSASYKGITDLVTKWVWPLPAREVVRVLARRGVKPNSVTAVGYLLTVLATWFFFEGWFALGLAAGWLMTFLDTVDGKLARCTLTSSKIGNFLDHGLDLIHPPFWWAAWAYGLPGGLEGHALATWIIVVGYVTGRLLEGVFLLFFKQEIFCWRRFDSIFRTVIARRNPNLILLSVGTAAGRPDLGFQAVALWTLVANVVPAVRIVQAFLQQRQGRPIRPWYEELEPPASAPGDETRSEPAQ